MQNWIRMHPICLTVSTASASILARFSGRAGELAALLLERAGDRDAPPPPKTNGQEDERSA